jgi:hypothetical protein
MQNLSRSLTLIPAWLLALALKSFLSAAHPWKHQRMTLKSLSERATPFAVELSACIWLSGFFAIILAAYAVTRSTY